jgi:hypothetical protein
MTEQTIKREFLKTGAIVRTYNKSRGGRSGNKAIMTYAFLTI